MWVFMPKFFTFSTASISNDLKMNRLRIIPQQYKDFVVPFSHYYDIEIKILKSIKSKKCLLITFNII